MSTYLEEDAKEYNKRVSESREQAGANKHPAWDEGFGACSGFSSSKKLNPYTPGSEAYIAWLNGWTASYGTYHY